MGAEPPFDSTTHLTAHLIRELESSLRWALEPYKDRSTETQKTLTTEDAEALLEKLGIPETDPTAIAWLQFADTLAPSHKDDIKAILKGLEIPETDSIAVAWVKLAGTFHSLAHRDNLAPPRQLDDKFRQFWELMNEILHVVLDRLESRYLRSIQFLDDLLVKPLPTRQDAKKLQKKVPNNPALYQYFFHRLSNPAWLKPLDAQKIFKHPPEPIYERTDTGTMVSYSPWPQSRCLVRMAAVNDATVQQTVLEIALKIETENIFIHMDLVDVAKTLPVKKAAELARKEITWIENQRHIAHLLPEKLGELIAHLADGGEVDAALALARSTLAVLPNPRAEENTGVLWSLHRDPISRLEGWDYGRIHQLCLPALVKAGGTRTLEMFCDLLETAINFYEGSVTPEDTDDHSDIWRHDIDHRSHHNVKDYLVSAVHKSVERLAEFDPGQVPALVDILESRRWLIFKRVALHLLRLAPNQARSLVTERLLDRANFDERGLWHEYTLLARDQFNNLIEEEREQILAWIDEGPSLDDVKQQLENFLGKSITDEQAERSEKARKLRRLAPLREVLPEDWVRRYEEWVKDTNESKDAEYIDPDLQERLSFGGPNSAEVLRSKSVTDIITFLAGLQHPTGDSINQLPESFSSELTSSVEAEPEKFAVKASRFRSLDPIYLRSFLYGLLNAVQRSKTFPWKPVLTLCRWILRQHQDLERRGHRADAQEKNWSGARSAVAQLLLAGFKEGVAEIPFHLRQAAWQILKPFTDDPHPMPEDEEQQETEQDFAPYALNTTRGEALKTVMHYALWVRRHVKVDQNGEGNFDDMPEVRKTLEYHLNPKHDPSLAVRSVYGQWLPNLIKFDQSWVKQNLAKIFPADEDSRDLLNTAWEAYIRSWGAYTDIFEVLRDEYGRAIERIGEEKNKGQHTHTLDQRLAQHMMRLYSYGKLNLDDTEGLLARFYAKAPDSLCGHALWHVGYTFHELKEEVHPVVLQRFKALWQKRLSVARSAPELHTGEMTAFGYLFYCEKFDNAWSITELNNALEISKWVEPDLFVIERLARLARDHAELAIKCLGYMVEGAKEEWALNSWGLPIRTIITAARRSNDDATRQIAVELVHRLGARQHTEFLDLLSDNPR